MMQYENLNLRLAPLSMQVPTSLLGNILEDNIQPRMTTKRRWN